MVDDIIVEDSAGNIAEHLLEILLTGKTITSAKGLGGEVHITTDDGYEYDFGVTEGYEGPEVAVRRWKIQTSTQAEKPTIPSDDVSERLKALNLPKSWQEA